MSRSSDTREKILRAAEDVVITNGVAHLTIEAAAARAMVSKGGVLYHFPTRAALIAAMVMRLSDGFDADLAAYGAHDGRRGAFNLAYIEATFSPGAGGEDHRERRLGAALFAGIASDAELLEPLRERFRAWREASESDGVDPVAAMVVRLCCDGLWLGELFGFAPLDAGDRGALKCQLRQMLVAGRSGRPSPAARAPR